MLTQEKAEVLSKILVSDQEHAKALLALSPEEALAQINAQGNDFTLEDVKEYGEALKATAAQSEVLDTDALDAVAGGIAPIIAGAIVGASSLLSYNISKNAPW